MDELNDRISSVQVGDVYVSYGRIPSGLLDGWSEVIFFFQTNESKLYYDSNEYEKVIQPLIDKLKSQNDESNHGVRWVETKKEAVVWTSYCQTTLVSFRIRDSY